MIRCLRMEKAWRKARLNSHDTKKSELIHRDEDVLRCSSTARGFNQRAYLSRWLRGRGKQPGDVIVVVNTAEEYLREALKNRDGAAQ